MRSPTASASAMIRSASSLMRARRSVGVDPRHRVVHLPPLARELRAAIEAQHEGAADRVEVRPVDRLDAIGEIVLEHLLHVVPARHEREPLDDDRRAPGDGGAGGGAERRGTEQALRQRAIAARPLERRLRQRPRGGVGLEHELSAAAGAQRHPRTVAVPAAARRAPAVSIRSRAAASAARRGLKK